MVAAIATSSIRSGGSSGVAADEFTDQFDDQVVGAGFGILAFAFTESVRTPSTKTTSRNGRVNRLSSIFQSSPKG